MFFFTKCVQWFHFPPLVYYMYSDHEKYKGQFFFYCTYFELILYLSAVQFFSVRKTLLKSLISFTSSYKKHAYKSVIFFFIYIFFIITFVLEEKYSTGQIEIESYVVGSLHNYILRSLKFALTGNWKVI